MLNDVNILNYSYMSQDAFKMLFKIDNTERDSSNDSPVQK